MKEFIYAIINFAILAAGIFIFFRKTIINIFRTRRLSIEQRLDEAENIVLPEADEAPSVPEDKSADEESAALQEIRQSIEKKAEKLKKYSELECREFALSKNNHELEAMLKLFSEDVAECFRSNPDYEKLDDEKNIEIIDEILASLSLTPGDMSYLRHHDVLYVTLTSARPLPEELR
ncbi:MAG: hypothetical protein MJ067_01460, partial [Oscillospiraceae bacterium]|nr:hypothetical protein [Oscillospiraceae bacterium]